MPVRAIVADNHDAYASAVALSTHHLDALVRLWSRTCAPSEQADRSTNLLERIFVVVRRRTNVIRRFHRGRCVSAR